MAHPTLSIVSGLVPPASHYTDRATLHVCEIKYVKDTLTSCLGLTPTRSKVFVRIQSFHHVVSYPHLFVRAGAGRMSVGTDRGGPRCECSLLNTEGSALSWLRRALKVLKLQYLKETTEYVSRNRQHQKVFFPTHAQLFVKDIPGVPESTG